MKTQALVLMLLSAAGANAALPLSRPPLFVQPPPAPNIVFTFDDSGSMERAVTPNEAIDNFLPNDGAVDKCRWRDFPHLFSSDANGQYYNPLVTYVPPVYADGTSFPPSNFTNAYLDGFAANKTKGSPNTGITKTNLALDYKPSLVFGASLGNTTTHTVINFQSTSTAGDCSTNGYRAWIREGARGLTGDVGFASGTASVPAPSNAGPQKQRAFYFTYEPLSPIAPAVPGIKLTLSQLYGHTGTITPASQTAKFNRIRYVAHLVANDAASQTNFANWYTYYRTRNLMGRTAATIAFSQLPPNIRIAWQGLTGTPINPINTEIARFGPTTPAVSAQRTNFFNFVNTILAPGWTPTRPATQRVTDFFSDVNTNTNNVLDPYYDLELSTATTPAVPTTVSCRQNYHMLFTDGGWNNTNGVANDPTFNGKNYDQNSPTVAPLPKTWVSAAFPSVPAFSVFPNGINTSYITSGPTQGGKGGYADLAFYGWATDLKSTLRNNVATFVDDRAFLPGLQAPPTLLPSNLLEVPQVYWNPKNDPATWQHVVQFVVAFGLTSGLDFPGDLNALRLGTKTWSDWNGAGESNDQFHKVDDTWHATLNSRGDLLSANNPQEVVQQMNQVFQSIADRSASVAAVSVSSSLLTTASLSFQTFFNASSWAGTVQGKRRQANGAADIVEWDAACRLDGGPCAAVSGNPTFTAPDPISGRTILTSNGSSGVNFDWSSISSAQQDALKLDFDNNKVPDSLGPDRLNYIRGVRTLEGSSFRARGSLFGAVVNSTALVVAGATDTYWRANQDPLRPKQFDGATGPEIKGTLTSGFLGHVEAVKNRPTTVYVGANDGMLHALDAATGVEKWAYVPGAVYGNLARLTSKSNLFTQSYVDSSPVVREVYTDGRWRTLLVGALRLGGQGVYALDVTDPSPSVAPSTRVKWEFSDANSSDLGLTYGRPIIARVRGGKWAVLVPGGYNADDVKEGVNAAAGSERAVLFVLDASNGTLLRKFTASDFNAAGAGAGSIGLSSIVGGDYVFEASSSTGPLQVLSPGIPRPTDSKSITQDQVLDVAFAGDNDGNLWRFNFENDSPALWKVKKFYSGDGNPITAQPRIATADGYAIVSFGSGRFVAETDRNVTDKQNLYGIYDPGPDYSGTVTKTQLVGQTITFGTEGGRVVVYTTDNPVPAPTKFGWYAELPGVGERAIVAATYLLTPARLIFPTFTPNGDPSAANDPCRDSSLSTLYVLNPANGGPAKSEGFAAFDVNRDGVINGQDNSNVSGFQLPGFVAGATPVNQAGGGEFTVLGIGGGEDASLYAAGSALSGLCGGLDQPACVCDRPGLPPACTCGPPPPSGRAACGPCVKVVTDPMSQRQCPGGGLSQPLWRRTNSRDLPAWDPNERN